MVKIIVPLSYWYHNRFNKKWCSVKILILNILISSHQHVLNHGNFWIVIFIIIIINYHQNQDYVSCLTGAIITKIQVSITIMNIISKILTSLCSHNFEYQNQLRFYYHKSFPNYSIVTIIIIKICYHDLLLQNYKYFFCKLRS